MTGPRPAGRPWTAAEEARLSELLGRFYRSKAETLPGRDLRSHKLGQENAARHGICCATTFAAFRASTPCSGICRQQPDRRPNVGRHAGCASAAADARRVRLLFFVWKIDQFVFG